MQVESLKIEKVNKPTAVYSSAYGKLEQCYLECVSSRLCLERTEFSYSLHSKAKILPPETMQQRNNFSEHFSGHDMWEEKATF